MIGHINKNFRRSAFELLHVRDVPSGSTGRARLTDDDCRCRIRRSSHQAGRVGLVDLRHGYCYAEARWLSSAGHADIRTVADSVRCELSVGGPSALRVPTSVSPCHSRASWDRDSRGTDCLKDELTAAGQYRDCRSGVTRPTSLLKRVSQLDTRRGHQPGGLRAARVAGSPISRPMAAPAQSRSTDLSATATGSFPLARSEEAAPTACQPWLCASLRHPRRHVPDQQRPPQSRRPSRARDRKRRANT